MSAMRPLLPESRFTVLVDGDEIVCRPAEGPERRIRVDNLKTVWFEADEGPWGIDWWVLEDDSADEIAFPLGAIGEAAVLKRLKELPGFAMRGMNATKRSSFRCWEAKSS